MRRSWRGLTTLILATVLASGCSTSPPGAGFTNGEKPPTAAEESPKVRSDLPEPAPRDSGDAPLAGSAPDLPDKDLTLERAQPKGK